MLGKHGPSFQISVKRIVLPLVLVLMLAGVAMGYYNCRVTGDPLMMPYQVHEATYAMAPVSPLATSKAGAELSARDYSESSPPGTDALPATTDAWWCGESEPAETQGTLGFFRRFACIFVSS